MNVDKRRIILFTMTVVYNWLKLFCRPKTKAAELFSKLCSNRIVAQSFQINGLRVLALSLAFLGSVWASRCLGPTNLGISGMVIGTIIPLVLLVNLNQTAHFVRVYKASQTEKEKADLITIISTYKIVATLALSLFVLPFVLFAHLPPIWHVALAAAFPFFFLTANAADWLLQSEEKIPIITTGLTLQSLITTALYICILRPGMSAGIDLMIQDAGMACALCFAWMRALRGREVVLFDWRKLRDAVPILVEGRWVTAVGVAVYIFTSLDAPLVGWLYSIKELGIYRTCISLVSGVQAFTAYIPMLLYPRMIEWNQSGEHHLWVQQKKAMGVFALFAFILAIAGFMVAPSGYHLIYGPAFQRGAYPFAFLLCSKLMSVLSGILGWGMVAQRRDRSLFKIMIYVSAFSLCSNLVFIPKFGIFAASTINFLSEVLMFFLISSFIRRSLRRSAS